jgi:DNA-binding ferritin-like protein
VPYVSKKADIVELEWEDQRKQLLATIDGTVLELLSNPIRLLILITGSLHFAARDAELNQLKMLVDQLADKVNARGDTPAERLAAVENRVDEVATHGIRLGTTLGLAAMATHTGVDYSIRPRGF